MSMEHLTISGRLGKDAEIKTTARGSKYVSFPLAVDAKGTTNWYNVSSFQENHLGKIVEYLKKGKGLIVSGVPSYSAWTDKSGNARIDLNVRAFNIEFPSLGGNRENGENKEQSTDAQPAVATTTRTTVQAPAEEPEDELPF